MTDGKTLKILVLLFDETTNKSNWQIGMETVCIGEDITFELSITPSPHKKCMFLLYEFPSKEQCPFYADGVFTS